VFNSKPGVGPVDLGLETQRDAFVSSGRRAMGMSPRSIAKKDLFSVTNNGNQYSLSSTSILGKDLYSTGMTEREATIYGGNPIWSDAGRANYARDSSQRDTIFRPLIGTISEKLTDSRFNEDHNRLPAKFSPASRTVRRGCPDLAERHPNGRPFHNVTLAVPPQRQDEDATHWHYEKEFNSSHGTNIVPHRSNGGKFFRGSGVTGDTMMNTRTETIEERDFFDMGTKPRTLNGGGYSRAVKAREDALLNQRGRLKRTEKIPDELMEATKDALGKRAFFIVKEDMFNPKEEADNSAYVTPTAEWQSTQSYTNQQARVRLQKTQTHVERRRVEEAQNRATLFRR